MKGSVALIITLSICTGLVNTEAGSKDEPTKPVYNMANSIGSTPKPDLLSYQQITQHYGNKYQPQQMMFQQFHNDPRTQLQQSSPYSHQAEPPKKYHHQPTPVAMVIIAQPAYIPASMLQSGNVAQQLIQYFQGANSQRYQYIPVNHQPYYNQPQIPVQTQQFPQYLPYQPPAEFSKYQPPAEFNKYQPSSEFSRYHSPSTSPPLAQAQVSSSSPQTKFQLHEALPSPQSLISQHHIVPHHLPQQNLAPEGRALNYQNSQQEVEVQPQQLQEIDQQQPEEPHSPEITRIAQQAAQHFLSTGGFQSGSRTAPAIITGLELFSAEQQEKIKAQLSEHFGSPLKPLNLQAKQMQEKPGRNNFYQEFKQRIKKERFVPSVQVQVKDGEIKQTAARTDGDKM